jgi:hypothetical protein
MPSVGTPPLGISAQTLSNLARKCLAEFDRRHVARGPSTSQRVRFASRRFAQDDTGISSESRNYSLSAVLKFRHRTPPRSAPPTFARLP